MKKRTKTGLSLFIYLLLLPILSWAQPEDAVKGTITTTDGKEMSILLDYDIEDDVLLGFDMENQRQYTYSPNSAVGFQFYDRDLQRQRQFYSLPYRENGQISKLYFFEALVEGPVSLLGREYTVENDKGGTVDPAGRILVATTELTRWVYFTVSEEQEIAPLKIKPRTILALMGNRKDEIKAYMDRWELDVTFQKDLIKIFKEYNRLVSEGS